MGTEDARALGSLGSPLLGQRELGIGAVGWDVSSLEFKLIPFGLSPKAVDGRFTAATAKALARLQAARALRADGIAGKQTYRALAGDGAGGSHPPSSSDLHGPGGRRLLRDCRRLGVSPLLLAKKNRLELSAVIVPGQKLILPDGAKGSLPGVPARRSRAVYRATPSGRRSTAGRPSTVSIRRLARATAWMESGFQSDVVSNAGAVGVMQLLPGTWQWVDEVLLRTTTPRTYDGNVRAGVRYLRWLLDEFDGNTQARARRLLPGCAEPCATAASSTTRRATSRSS